jgi:hypothetical protein
MQIDHNSLSRRLLHKMDRRSLLGRGAAILGGLLPVRPGAIYGQTKSQTWTQQGSDAWNVVVAGETMAVRPFSMPFLSMMPRKSMMPARSVSWSPQMEITAASLCRLLHKLLGAIPSCCRFHK